MKGFNMLISFAYSSAK